MDGIETLKAIKAAHPQLQVVMMSGHGTIETAVKATKLGAFDFIEKPLSLEKVILVGQPCPGPRPSGRGESPPAAEGQP